MDFQFARNLSAISRALQSISEALLHVGSSADCLNREVILPANISEEAEQQLEEARKKLLQVQAMLNERLDEVEGRLRAAQVAYLLDRPQREGQESDSSVGAVHSIPTRRQGAPSCSTCRQTTFDGHSYAETAVRGPVREPRSE